MSEAGGFHVKPQSPSARVSRAREAGWIAVGRFAAVSWYALEFRSGRGKHETVSILAGDRMVEVTTSPTGRVTHVYVDGKEIPA